MPEEENGLGDDGKWIEETVRRLLAAPQETRFVPFLPDTRQIARKLIRDTTTFGAFLTHVQAGVDNKKNVESPDVRVLYAEPTLLALGLGILRAVAITPPGVDTPLGYITVTVEGMGYHEPPDPKTVATYQAYIDESDQRIANRFPARLNTLRATLNTFTSQVPQDDISPITVEFRRAIWALSRLELSAPGDHWREITMWMLASHVESLRGLIIPPGPRLRGGI